MIATISFPSPPPLLPSLLEAGFNHEIAAAASKLYQRRAEEFKRRTETTLIAAWQKMEKLPGALALSLDPLTRKEVSTLTDVYLRCLEEWKEEMVQLLKDAPKVPSKTAPRNPRSFNNEYLPLLEHFFEENPFPTHADKFFLAKKSNMQYRQIHVWFQNRRSRTKKDDKPLRKKPISEGATKHSGKLYERMKTHVVKPTSQTHEPSRPSLSGVDNEIRITQSNALKSPFISLAPPHAFPSPYPPPCTYDPFPCKSGPISFGKPEWRRVSCLKPLPDPISVDDLVEKFSQLNVRGRARVNGSPGLRSHAATAAITVKPSCAPHPSLIVQDNPKLGHGAMHDLSVRPPASRPHAFQNPSLTIKPTTLVPLSVPSHKSDPSAKRKTVPLPQRSPRRMQNIKRDTTPSERSSTPPSYVFSAGSESPGSSLSSASHLSSPTDLPASAQKLPR